MQPVHKLIQQIRDATAQGGGHAPLEALAAEYARHCQEAGQRLDLCAAMLGKGSEYQALQLAETEPVLLDLIAQLSFAEVREWTALCAARGLPVPPRFDPKAVQALDALYARGIGANHPLYKDYRAAVSSHDEVKAMRAIRSIARLNPHDENARAELVRWENKLFQTKLKELRAVLPTADEAAVLTVLAEVERLAPPAKLETVPEYGEAMRIRKEAARREAMGLAARLVPALGEERQAGAWRMVGDLLARLAALQSEHGFQLSGEDAATCAEMKRYSEAERSAADAEARFSTALTNVREMSERLETRLLTRATLALPEARQRFVEYNRAWKEVERFDRAAPEELAARVRTNAAAWRTEIGRLQRRRRWQIVGASAAALLLLGLAAWRITGALQARDYAQQLAALRDAGQVEVAETMAAHLRRERPGLAARAALQGRLGEIEQWARDERASLADAEARIAELETAAGSSFAGADPIALHAGVESAAALVDRLAAGARVRPASRMTAVRQRFDAQLATWQEQLHAEAERELTALETLAGAQLGYEQPRAVLAEAVAALDPRLKPIEARVQPAVPALALDAAQAERARALRQRCDLFRGELDALKKTDEAVLVATTLEEFRQALEGYQSSRLGQVQEVNDARKLLAAFPRTDDVLAALLLPGDPEGWAAARAELGGERFVPEQVLPEEISRFIALRDDPYLNDISEVTLIDYRRGKARREVFARGEVRMEGPSDVNGTKTTVWRGQIYEPNPRSEIPAFAPTIYTATQSPFGTSGTGEVSAIRRSTAAETLARLELNRMTDATGTKYERPLLRVFDDLVRDKAGPALGKAFLVQQLGAVLELRPRAWGQHFCPSLRRDLAAFAHLADGVALRSEDWLLERRRTELTPRFAPFFAGLQDRTYLAEARLHREIVRAVMNAGVKYGGYVDAAGQPHLLGEARSVSTLWVLGPEGRGVVRYAEAKTAGFSPVFFVPLDREAVLAEAQRKVGAKLPRPALPWFAAP